MKEEIIKELSDQVEECRISCGMESTSWGNQCGVLISGDMAKNIITLLGEKDKEIERLK